MKKKEKKKENETQNLQKLYQMIEKNQQSHQSVWHYINQRTIPAKSLKALWRQKETRNTRKSKKINK